jgi:hypothetical protein
VRRESAQFFVDWVRERISTLKLNDPREREEVMEPMREAEQFWQNKLAEAQVAAVSPDQSSDARRPTSDADLHYWLENMVVFHRFTTEEIRAATGLSSDEISAALRKFDLANKTVPRRAAGDPLRVLPYPGGRHPRIGFLDGASCRSARRKLAYSLPGTNGATSLWTCRKPFSRTSV